MIKDLDEVFINTSMTYCKVCKMPELVAIVANKNGVFIQKQCKKYDGQDVKIASDYEWYMNRTTIPQKIKNPKRFKKFKKGCPLDCGLCENHTNGVHLPVFSITNDCNLNCPICFTYNRQDKKYYKSIVETQKLIDNLLKQEENYEVINLTGGEPTLHPDFFKIIEVCRRKKIKRITVNTNGIRIASDYEFAERIKDANIQMVLSLNTFDSNKSKLIHGKDISKIKRKALETFEKLDIPITILSVPIKNVNEKDVVDIVSKYIKKKFVKSFIIQNMTFTGNNGSKFLPREHITIDEVENNFATNEIFSKEDYFQLGSAHPLCYSVAYYITNDKKIVSLTKIINKTRLMELSGDSYLLSTSEDISKELLDGINKLWAKGEDETLLNILRTFIKKLYPSDKQITTQEREKIAETMIKPIYIHSHMDEDNFDIDRVSRCADIVPDESGALIPACSYNLIYREKDERFWKK